MLTLETILSRINKYISNSRFKLPKQTKPNQTKHTSYQKTSLYK